MDTRPLTTPSEILQAALTREQEARDFYAQLGLQTHVSYVKDLLQYLTEEETRHVRLVQSMITRLDLGHDILPVARDSRRTP